MKTKRIVVTIKSPSKRFDEGLNALANVLREDIEIMVRETIRNLPFELESVEVKES